jgi:tetratricopeptide (TPR) repeat protein
MLKEAEFAFRQSFAYCPSSPEAVYHYVTLLYGIGRLDDAERVASTWLRLDPFNRAVQELVRNLQSMKNSGQGKPQTTEVQAPLDQLEKDFHDNSNNFQAGLLLAAGLVQIQSNNLALPVLDKILANPKVDLNTIMLAAQGYAQMSNYSKLEGALNQAVVAYPHSPEAWYNLAGVEAFIGKKPEAIKALSQALDESGKRLTKDPKASNLRIEARTDERFAALRQSPEFQQLTK